MLPWNSIDSSPSSWNCPLSATTVGKARWVGCRRRQITREVGWDGLVLLGAAGGVYIETWWDAAALRLAYALQSPKWWLLIKATLSLFHVDLCASFAFQVATKQEVWHESDDGNYLAAHFLIIIHFDKVNPNKSVIIQREFSVMKWSSRLGWVVVSFANRRESNSLQFVHIRERGWLCWMDRRRAVRRHCQTFKSTHISSNQSKGQPKSKMSHDINTRNMRTNKRLQRELAVPWGQTIDSHHHEFLQTWKSVGWEREYNKLRTSRSEEDSVSCLRLLLVTLMASTYAFSFSLTSKVGDTWE